MNCVGRSKKFDDNFIQWSVVMLQLEIERLKHEIETCDGFQVQSRLQIIEDGFACALPAALGDQCLIMEKNGRQIPAEIIGFKRNLCQLAPFENAENCRWGRTFLRCPGGLRFP